MHFVSRIRILQRRVETSTHHVLHQAGHGLEVSGAHLAGVGPLGDVLLTPAVVLQLGHAPDELADGLVLGNEIKDHGGSPAKVQIPLPSLGFEAWTLDWDLDSISHQNNIINVKIKFLRCGLCRGPCL